jgi:hypothetical protein
MKSGYGDVCLELRDILPKNKKMPYDKMRPPKLEGKIKFFLYLDNCFDIILIYQFVIEGRL